MLANLALTARVRAALKDRESTRDINISIDSDAGQVVLSGIVLNAQESAEAARVAETVTGVTRVDNHLRLMATTRRFAAAKH